jgi:hypothetical protein
MNHLKAKNKATTAQTDKDFTATFKDFNARENVRGLSHPCGRLLTTMHQSYEQLQNSMKSKLNTRPRRTANVGAATGPSRASKRTAPVEKTKNFTIGLIPNTTLFHDRKLAPPGQSI